MKKRRLFSIMAASVLAVSLLAGCGGKSATADGQTDKAEAQAQSGQSSEKKVLRVWLEKVFSDDANTFLQKRVEQYAQEKGVEVQFEFLSATDFVPKLNAAIEAGSNIPDITLTSGNRALNYYPNIPNVDVTELVDEINEKRPYFDSVYEGAKYGGVNFLFLSQVLPA